MVEDTRYITSMSQLENSSMVASFILFYNPMHRDQNMTNDRGGKGRNSAVCAQAHAQPIFKIRLESLELDERNKH